MLEYLTKVEAPIDGWTSEAVEQLEDEEFVLEDHPSVDPDQSGDLEAEDWSGEFKAE